MLDNTRGELATGLVCLALSAIGLLQIARQPSAPVMGGDLGPTFLPSVLLYMLGLLGGILVAWTGYRILRQRGGEPAPEHAQTPAQTVVGDEFEAGQPILPYARFLPLAILVAMCVCVVSLPHLGFDLSVACFFFVVGLFLHRIKTGAFRLRGIALCVLEAVLLTAALSLMLRFVLRIPLP